MNRARRACTVYIKETLWSGVCALWGLSARAPVRSGTAARAACAAWRVGELQLGVSLYFKHLPSRA